MDVDDASAAAQAQAPSTELSRLEREIQNNPIWNYSEMLNFDPDVILSLPAMIRNDIIPPEFQNEVSTYLSMYQQQIAQRDALRTQPPAPQQQQQQQQQQQSVDESKNNDDNAGDSNHQ